MFVPEWIIEIWTALAMFAIAMTGRYIMKNQDKYQAYWIGCACGFCAMLFMAIMLVLMDVYRMAQ